MNDFDAYYEAYFRDIATRLSDLGHCQTAPRFWLNSDTDSLSEIENAVRTNLKLPCLVLDAPEFSVPVGTDNVRERLTGAFSILCKYEQGSTASLTAARRKARQTANKIRNYLIRDAAPCQQSIANPNSLYRRGVYFYEDITGDYTRVVKGVAVGFFYEIKWEHPVDVSYGANDFA